MRTHRIILVHGTFAPAARWKDQDSSFRVAVAPCLEELTVVWEEGFNWGGWNSPVSRFEGALKLRERISQSAEPVILVCHSHGGNLAVAALADSDTRRRVRGLVCLATPFLHFRIRNLKIARIALAISISSILWGVFIGGLWKFIGFVLFAAGTLGDYDPVASLDFGFIPAATALLFTALGFAWTFQHLNIRIETLHRRASARLKSLMFRATDLHPMLTVWARRDEALPLLYTTTTLSNLAYYFMPIFVLGVYIFIFYLGGESLVEAFQMTGISFSALPAILQVTYVVILAYMSLALASIPFALYIPLLVGLAVLARSHPGSLGFERVSSNILVKVDATREPPCKAPFEMLESRHHIPLRRRLGLQLYHSVYDDPKIAKEVGEWIATQIRSDHLSVFTTSTSV